MSLRNPQTSLLPHSDHPKQTQEVQLTPLTPVQFVSMCEILITAGDRGEGRGAPGLSGLLFLLQELTPSDLELPLEMPVSQRGEP